MTIRKKLFWTNTFMVLLAMLVLLGIGGSMICLFKDEFLRWYGSHSQLGGQIHGSVCRVPGGVRE